MEKLCAALGVEDMKSSAEQWEEGKVDDTSK